MDQYTYARTHPRTHARTHARTHTKLIRQAILASKLIESFSFTCSPFRQLRYANQIRFIRLIYDRTNLLGILFFFHVTDASFGEITFDDLRQAARVWSSPLESPWTRPVLWRTSAGSACRVEISTIFSVAGLATVKVLPCRSGTAIFQNRCDDCVRPQPTHFAAGRCTGGRFPRSSHLRPSSARQPWKKVQFPNKCTG